MSLPQDIAAIRKGQADVLDELRKLNKTEEAIAASLDKIAKALTPEPPVGIEVVPGQPQTNK